MKKIMAAGLIFTMICGSLTPAAGASAVRTGVPASASEAKAGHWAEAALREWTGYGVVQGYENGSLQPDRLISRAELAAMLHRVFGYDGGGAGSAAFTDTADQAWYGPALEAVFKAGVITGYGDGTFKPQNPVSRQDVAVMLSRAFQLVNDSASLKANVLESFEDAASIGSYSAPALKAMITSGVMQGYPDGTLRPKQPLTRGEAVVLLDRLAGTLYSKAGTYDESETLDHAVVNKDGVILKNKQITGNLYLAPGIGTGDVSMENSAVSGKTYINGGGEHSVHITSSTLGDTVLAHPEHPIRAVLGGKTVIGQLALKGPMIAELSEGTVIHSLVLHAGSSGTVISGKGEIASLQAETDGIKVNGVVLAKGQKMVWSSESLKPANAGASTEPGRTAGESSSPSAGSGGSPGGNNGAPGGSNGSPGGDNGTSGGNNGTPGGNNGEPGGGNGGGEPSAEWSPVVSVGDIPGTAQVSASVPDGHTLAVLVAHHAIETPKAGDSLPKDSLLIHPYQPGDDISGVDASVNKYLGVYEVDASKRVVHFRQIILTEADVKPETWSMVWNDEFESSEIDGTKWNYIQGGGGYGNNELQNYTNRRENARIEDGKLVIEAHKEAYQGNDYTSAKLTTEGKGDWTYGKFEVRAKMPEGKGIWPAIWMMPTDQNLYSGWPASGEIDIMELLGHEPNKIYGTLHYGVPHDEVQGSYTLPDGSSFSDSYHTFSVEWEPGEFRFYVDGILYAKQNDWFSQNVNEAEKYTYPAPFDRDFFMQLNLAVGGNWPGSPDSSTVFPQQMLVDYVRVYEREMSQYRQPVEPASHSVVIREPGADGSYIVNGSFEDGLNNWIFQPFGPPEDLFGGRGSVALDQGAVLTSIEQEGDVEYAVQLVQTDIPLIKGAEYRLSFDAWSSADRSMTAAISGPNRNYARYMNDQTLSLSAQRQTYTFDFVMASDPDPDARLEFNMGKAGVLPVWIDEVRLHKIADPDPSLTREALPGGSLIYNGTFDQGKNRLAFWSLDGPAAAEAYAQVGSAIEERKLYVKPAAPGPADSLLLSQNQLGLKENQMYVLSFEAKAAAEGSVIQAAIGNESEPGLYGEQSFTVGTAKESYTMIINMGVKESAGKLVFKLGALPGLLELDNVMLKEMAPPVIIDGFSRIEAENYSDMRGVQKGEDGLSVGWIDPGDWMQYIVDVKQAGEYKVSYYVASGYETGGSLKLLMKRGSVLEHTFPAGEMAESEADAVYTLDVANTGDWGRFVLVDQMITLEEGTHTLQLYAPHVNVDYMLLAPSDLSGTTRNVVRNGTFDENVGEWRTYQEDQLSISSVNGEMKVHLPSLTPDAWNQQVYQDGLTLVQGVTYTVTFDAYSTVDRPIQLGVGHIDSSNNYAYTDFLAGGKPTLWLTSEKKSYQFSFVMNNPTELNAKLEFNLGQITVGDTVYSEAGDLFLDNIRLSGGMTPSR
ncbi:hypothetical protein DNH61_12080 [Paenibacillus sambharensis]|uniref:Licheninase n=1 Tax=Paenibacillus sambharensis TaxID=1803190 RepID=A0A2W1LK52_9BACL|nr:carbohydrate binding domain-containing protein [Paenibacillus sambharensis]PZD95285.1 hypothetical protein DNH61_12080 [Paenibacillus sambharensis]